MIYKPQFIALVILSILDALTTIYLLEFTTNSYEANPIVAYLLNQIGYLGALVITKAGVLGLLYYLFTRYKEDCTHWFIEYGTWFMITYYIFVVTWNIIGIIE